MDMCLTQTYVTVSHIHLFGVLAILIVTVLPFWRLFRKVGFPGPLSLLILVPGVNLVLLYFVAFSRTRAVS